MNNLPKEFYEWLRKLKHPHIVYLRERKEWFDLLPETCRIALVVEWLEVEMDTILLVDHNDYDDDDPWEWRILFIGAWVTSQYEEGIMSRTEALKAGIDKALKLIAG